MEQQREKEDQELKTLLDKINKAGKTRKSLQRSLATLRQPSPTVSPGRPKKQCATQKHRGQTKALKQAPTTVQVPATANKREYSEVFNSFMNLQQGNTEYAELVANVMDPTDNIMSLRLQSPHVSPEK